MSNKLKILVVEDEEAISNFIATTLKANDYNVIMARTGKEALSMIPSHCPDVILLDLGLPDIDGIDILQQIREWSNIPVIVVSARTEEADKVKALDMGADDYIAKPFGTSELLARIRTALRHVAKGGSGNAVGDVFIGDLSLIQTFFHIFYNLPDFFHLPHRSDHWIHNRQISVDAGTVDRSDLGAKHLFSIQADPDSSISHGRIQLLRQIHIVRLLVCSQVHRPNDDSAVSHGLRYLTVYPVKLSFSGIVLSSQILKLTAQ